MNFDVGVFIPQDDSVRLLRNIVEEIDFSKVYSAYSDRGRKTQLQRGYEKVEEIYNENQRYFQSVTGQ
ncbi:MAG: hypothetical protein F8N39_07760 [Clostridiaceae bacterium]|nr:hypothetical protein [Clostridiaceae bacterium]